MCLYFQAPKILTNDTNIQTVYTKCIVGRFINNVTIHKDRLSIHEYNVNKCISG